MFKFKDKVKILDISGVDIEIKEKVIGKIGTVIQVYRNGGSYAVNIENAPELNGYVYEKSQLKLIKSITLEKEIPVIRTFGTGATRDTDANKLDYEGFLSPLVLERYAQYLNKHRVQSDGQLRDSDNWQKGIPKETYIKSKFRHFMATWLSHRNHIAKDEKGNHVTLEDSLCGDIFNTMGYLHELLIEKESIKPKQETTDDSDGHIELIGNNI